MKMRSSKIMKITPLILLFLIKIGSPLDITECISALGMESGDIRDDAITSSSTHNEANVGPQNARLNREMKSGAWCPEQQINGDVHEYLELHLSTLHVLTAVATQGRFGNGQGQEYAEEYLLEYWRPGLTTWKTFADRKGNRILQGNTNTYAVVKRLVDPPIIATKVRFVPHSVYLRTICMRVEIYGCIFRDGLLSYSVPVGDRRGTDLDFSDKTYDGKVDNNRLIGGLGQLVDGRRGFDNFRSDISEQGRGYDWVGWRNNLMIPPVMSAAEGVRTIKFIFTFDVVRNFSAAHFHCNNMYTRGVQVFSSAVISFSVGGIYFGSSFRLTFVPDLTKERARTVTLRLLHGVGRHLKIELEFEAPWILISEVAFESVPASGNFTEEEPPIAPPIVSTALNEDVLGERFVGLVIGVLAAATLLLILIIMAIIVRHQRRKNQAQSVVAVNMKDLGMSFSSCPPTGTTMYDEIGGCDALKESNDLQRSYASAYSKGNCFRQYAIPDRHGQSSINFRGICGTSVYQLSSEGNLPKICFNEELKELPRNKLRHMEILGKGQFGEVHLCRAEGIPHGSTSSLVSVRILQFDSDPAMKSRFLEEAQILSMIRDANVACVVGLYQDRGLPCLVVQHTENGDLYHFLRRHSPEDAHVSTTNILSYGCLIYMAVQVASGMKHLCSVGLVHRDLAARNCLVERFFSIKISDLASSRIDSGLFSSHYYRINGAMLPVRWMAPETLQGKLTPKSDVWSFGVTLWEILTFARRLPFCELDDEQVVEQLGKRTLSPPRRCPREICDLMHECLKRTDVDRPAFVDIHLFLQRKNFGYKPPGT